MAIRLGSWITVQKAFYPEKDLTPINSVSWRSFRWWIHPSSTLKCPILGVKSLLFDGSFIPSCLRRVNDHFSVNIFLYVFMNYNVLRFGNDVIIGCLVPTLFMYVLSSSGMLKYGRGSRHAAAQNLEDVCRDLHCQRERYTWTSHPALEGTKCGEDMVSFFLKSALYNDGNRSWVKDCSWFNFQWFH